MPTVVAIAGVAGAGKSSVVRELVGILPGAQAIHVDDYQRVTREPLDRLAAWLQDGADFDRFQIPLLGDHLSRLKRGEVIMDPIRMREISAERYVVFETHFGRAHQDTGRHIDVLVWVDTPLDIALARNVRSLLKPLLPGGGLVPDATRLLSLDGHLERYLASVRPLIELQVSRVRAGADLCVAGSGSPLQTARTIAARLGDLNP